MASINPHFQETQRFTQWWLWLLLIGIFLSPIVVNTSHILEHGFRNTFDRGILFHFFTIGPLLLLFMLLKLKTTVDEKGINIHYFPLLRRSYSWKEIARTELIHYQLTDTLGWGIRLWTKFGTVYNVKGNKGLHIQLHSSKNLMIGTQQPEKLQMSVNQFKK